jgi:hypothetical protein
VTSQSTPQVKLKIVKKNNFTASTIPDRRGQSSTLIPFITSATNYRLTSAARPADHFARQGNAATPQSKHLLAHRGRLPSTALFVWLISHQPTVFFSQNKPAISNQPTILFSQNKTAPAISH